MKKLIWFILLLIIVGGLKAQDSLETKRGITNIEVNFNPFDGGLQSGNGIEQFKIRRFITNHYALRCAFNFTMENENDDYKISYGKDLKVTKKSLGIFLNLGIEKHIKAGKRISPYYGVEIAFEYKNIEFNNDNDEFKAEEVWITLNEDKEFFSDQEYRGYYKIGPNFIFGVDFYLAKGFYIGYELNYSIAYKKYQELDNSPFNTSLLGLPIEEKNGHDTFTSGAKLFKGIRIGYEF